MEKTVSLPFASEFSPSQIYLPDLLQLCYENNGAMVNLQEEIRQKYFIDHGNGNYNNQNKLAMNCRLGLRTYGIINEDGELTPFGEELYSVRSDEPLLYDTLAKHILLNLHGMAFLQCLKDIAVSGEKINLTTLRPALLERGIKYPSGGKHPSMMKLWLEKAGIISKRGWVVNDARVREILGTAPDDMIELIGLTQQQRCFLMALANIGGTKEVPANEIVKLASATYGIQYPEKSLPKEVLNALVDAGYIIAKKTTAGRGAKPFIVTPTDKLSKDIVAPLLNQIQSQTDPKLVELLRKPLVEILEELYSTDRYISGLALEALAFKLMRLIDMDYVATRLRAQQTGGSEVDLIFESARLIYSRWQIQCNNTARVALDDVAKEVGLTHFLKSNAIVVVSTGTISSEAKRYANKVMQDSNLCIIMVEGDDIEKIKNNPSKIVDVFNEQAKMAMSIKKLEL